MRLKQNSSLCVGTIGLCKCSHPPSPRLGIVPCSATDPTQSWVAPTAANNFTIFGGAGKKHDINSGVTCPGDDARSMLLFPYQVCAAFDCPLAPRTVVQQLPRVISPLDSRRSSD